MKFNESPVKKLEAEELPTETMEAERREEIMEKAEEERLLLGATILKKLKKLKKFLPTVNEVSDGVDLVPIAGNFKMIQEAAVGRTWIGEKLNKEDKIMYSLIVITSFMGYGLVKHGISEGEVLEVLSSVVPFAMSAGLTIKEKRTQIKRRRNEEKEEDKKFAKKLIKEIKDDK